MALRLEYGEHAVSEKAFTVIELSGHIIDSLILAKVIDKIQAVGCDYQINDIQIGWRKTDLSTAQISLWADSTAVLSQLLEDLQHEGARPVASTPVQWVACTNKGQLPEKAYVRRIPPMEVMLENTWLPVKPDHADMAVVLDPVARTAVIKPVEALEVGDHVVTGVAGIKILPVLEERSHATTR